MTTRQPVRGVGAIECYFAQALPIQYGWGELMDTTQRTDQQRSADRRRRELLEAADRVVLRDGPQASMNAIAAAAGITKPILYRHFGDKGGLYAALAVRYMQRFFHISEEALGEQNPRRRLAKAVDAYLAAVEREPEVFRFVRRVTIEQRRVLDAVSSELD